MWVLRPNFKGILFLMTHKLSNVLWTEAYWIVGSLDLVPLDIFAIGVAFIAIRMVRFARHLRWPVTNVLSPLLRL